MLRALAGSILVVGVVVACAASETSRGVEAVAPPIAIEGPIYEAAAAIPLPEKNAEDVAGLHNVFHLSDDIVSGGEPDDEGALQALSKMGIKTILSVDGKVPDAATAARYGMKYVHVPIQYRGISEDELEHITKTFRELEGPFYVHCFHGKHRGPAAAAVGRLVLDGVSREQAVAEMRQYCGTSKSYEGLYATVAEAPIPDKATTEALPWDFPAAHPFEGYRQIMVATPRSFDSLTAMKENGWKATAEHPDGDPVGESAVLTSLMKQALELPETAQRPQDFREWIQTSYAKSQELHDALLAADLAAADAAHKAVKASCTACHAAYRD